LWKCFTLHVSTISWPFYTRLQGSIILTAILTRSFLQFYSSYTGSRIQCEPTLKLPLVSLRLAEHSTPHVSRRFYFYFRSKILYLLFPTGFFLFLYCHLTEHSTLIISNVSLFTVTTVSTRPLKVVYCFFSISSIFVYVAPICWPCQRNVFSQCYMWLATQEMQQFWRDEERYLCDEGWRLPREERRLNLTLWTTLRDWMSKCGSWAQRRTENKSAFASKWRV